MKVFLPNETTIEFSNSPGALIRYSGRKPYILEYPDYRFYYNGHTLFYLGNEAEVTNYRILKYE